MSYLVKSDYTLRISIDHLDKILAQAVNTSGLTADQVRLESENTAEAEINAYLSSNYDTSTEFQIDGTTSPDTRNKLIKRCMIDMSLYNIFFAISPRDIPESREKLYDNCVEMLKAYRDGELDFGLSVVDADQDGEPDVQQVNIGHPRKFISNPYKDITTIDEV